MIKDEVIKTLELLEKYGVNEEEQRKLLNNGLEFNFTYGDPDFNNENRYLGFLEVGELIDTLDKANIPFDITELINNPWCFEYPRLVRKIADKNKAKVKVKK